MLNFYREIIRHREENYHLIEENLKRDENIIKI